MSYNSYAELAAAQVLGVDYQIRLQHEGTSLAYAGIHAGSIETGTDEVVRGLAGEGVPGQRYSSYRFRGIKPSDNDVLHIESTDFDEPWCEWLLKQVTRVVTVHGAPGTTPITYVGGLDVLVRDRVINALQAAGFAAAVATGDIAGTDPGSVTNRGMSGAGVQLELSTAERARLFSINSAKGRWATRNELFHAYVEAVRGAVDCQDVLLG